jgi:hypothetical protein
MIFSLCRYLPGGGGGMALSARELQSGKGRHVMYSVTITTSNDSVKCGTDCAVYLTIHGVNGHTSVHSLRPLAVVSSKTFSAGAVDKFNIQDTDVINLPPPHTHTHPPSPLLSHFKTNAFQIIYPPFFSLRSLPSIRWDKYSASP